MATEIEKALMPQGHGHVLVSLSLSPKRIALEVAPWDEPVAARRAAFEQACIVSILAHDDVPEEEFGLPWVIQRFESFKIEDERWEFTLHCGSLILMFEAKWPEVE
jgi:hypothetical protein